MLCFFRSKAPHLADNGGGSEDAAAGDPHLGRDREVDEVGEDDGGTDALEERKIDLVLGAPGVGKAA